MSWKEIEGFSNVFEPEAISQLLEQKPPTQGEVNELLQAEAFNLSGLSRLILAAADETSRLRIVEEAVTCREKQWAGKLFLMPPLYISNICNDHCRYCGYNPEHLPNDQQRRLTESETYLQSLLLLNRGYGDIELVSATERALLFPRNAAGFVTAAKKAGAKNIGVNFMPLPDPDGYQTLKDAGCIFTIVWQETYDPAVYSRVHPYGPKSKMDYRLNAHDRTLQGGISTVGVAFLGGLSDWRFDALSTISHAQYLRGQYNANIIFGMPRWKNDPINPLEFIPTSYNDDEYELVGALYSLAIPESLPWFSTREDFELSARAARGGGCMFTLDCSTAVGGYTQNGYAQFPVHSRPYNEGVDWLKKLGFNPQIHLPW